MKYLELSPGWDEVSVLLPVWNGLYWKFTGLEWILLEIHRAVTKRGKFTGLEWILLEIHRAGMDFTGYSPGWNDFHRKCTG
jgi:hypothetical protein